MKKASKERVTHMQEDPKPQNERYRNTPEGKRYHYIAQLCIGVCAAVLVLTYLLFRTEHVGSAISWVIGSMRAIFLGLAFGYLLNPLDNSIRQHAFRILTAKGKRSPEKARKRARVLGVSLSSLFGIGVVIALLMLIIPSFINSISDLSSIISGNLEKITVWVQSYAGAQDNFSIIVNRCVDAAQKWINEDLTKYAADATGMLFSAGVQVVSYVMDFLIAFIVAIYTLLEKEAFARRSKKLLYAYLRPERANRVLDVCRHGNRIFGGFLSGKLLDSLLIGLLCFLAMTVLRIPYVVLVSVVIGCTNIIPFLGPFIGGIPCAAIILLASPQKGLVFIIMFLILQQLDGNVIGPMILGDRTGVSAFWIICSLLLFKALFGLLGTGMSIFGMIIGVPLFCVIDYVVSENVRRRLKKKNMDTGGIDFGDVEKYDTREACFVALPPREEAVPFKVRIRDYWNKLCSFFKKKKKK